MCISDWSSYVCSSDRLHRDESGSRIMAPMAQQVQYRRARQPERSGVAQRMDIDATLRREPRVEHHADAAGRRIDRGERGHRSWRDAEQALHVLGLAEADALAAAGAGERLQI